MPFLADAARKSIHMLSTIDRHLPPTFQHASIKARNTLGILEACSLSPRGSIKGLAREALGFEDPYIEFGKIQVAAEYIAGKLGGRQPQVLVTLGSGLGDLAEQIEDPIIIPYSEIPGFPHPQTQVAGHKGCLVIGQLEGKTVVAMQGRFHLYQGVTPRETVRPVRVMQVLGISHFIVTNAAGALNLDFKVGDLMLIKDTYNLTGQNCLVGPNIDELGPRFPSMSKFFSKEMRDLVKKAAERNGINLKEGVYVQVLGPNYEWDIEVRDLKNRGFDAVGMSTSQEVMAAKHAGIKSIIGITLITNIGAGLSDIEPKHEDVEAAGEAAKPTFQKLIRATLSDLP